MQLQVIEVGLGLVAAFFLVAAAASAVVELGSMWFRKRSKDLEAVLTQMLSTGAATAVDIRNTSVYKTMVVASRRKRGLRKDRDPRTPSYMSARAFADAVVEGIVRTKQAGQTASEMIATLPASPLTDRLQTLAIETEGDLLAIKSGLENWFDDTMDRLEGAYKRWSQWVLFVVGLLLAVVLNVSATRIVAELWNDSTLRTAVADSVVQIDDRPCPDDTDTCTPEEKIDKAISDLDGLGLPVGWTSGWDKAAGPIATILGMLITAAATMLGAPFWFDLLTRLAGARRAGAPPKAADDGGSATAALVAATAGTPRPTLNSL